MMKTKLEQSPILQTFFRQNSHRFHWQGHVWVPKVGPSGWKSSRVSRATGHFWTWNLKQTEGGWFSEHFASKNLVILGYVHQSNKKSDVEVVLPQTPLEVVADVKNTQVTTLQWIEFFWWNTSFVKEKKLVFLLITGDIFHRKTLFQLDDLFFSQEESNKRILALHWHFKNAKNINICLDQRCHYSSVWYFRIGIFHSKSIQQKLDFPHSWNPPFQKALPIPNEMTAATSGCVSQEPPEQPGWEQPATVPFLGACTA